MNPPNITEHEARTHATFTALMWALSYPGQRQELPEHHRGVLFTIGAALVDLETSYHTPDATLDQQLALLGARRSPPREAAYQFYPRVDADSLDSIARAPVGTYMYPDRAAMLVLGCTLGAGTRLRLSGPGIARAAAMLVGDIPEAFWSLRKRAQYPLGWDVVLVDGRALIGLPRTTVVEVG